MLDQHNQQRNPQNFDNVLHNKQATSQPQVQLEKLKKILDKQPQARTAHDNSFITNFIKQNITLRKLSEEISVQFVKNLFKNAVVVNMKKDKILQTKGQKIQDLGIVLSGQLAVLRNQQQMTAEKGVEDIIIYNSQTVLQKLFQYAKIYRKQLKRKQSSIVIQHTLKSKIFHTQKTYPSISLLISEQISTKSIYSYINNNQLLGFVERSLGQNFTRNCVCLNENTSILLFPQTHVMTCLQSALKDKIKKLTHILKGINCFKLLELDKLQLIIQNMLLKKRKRGEQIYRQNQQAKSFYLLVEGQVKVMKQTNLFQENPNTLYGNRKKLVEQSLTGNARQNQNKAQKIFLDKKVKKLMLPFANLTAMYNFRPMKKNIQIGIVTPFSLFGQQQYNEKKIRDTSAICSSIHAEYYQIYINKLEEIIGNKLISIFRKQLRQTVRKKVLYRQSQYATSVNFENKNNLDYFYLQGEKQKESPRKFKISKMNSLITSKKSTPISNVRQQPHLPSATFTNFNFNKMNRLTKTDRKQKKNDYQSENQQKYQQNANQLKIMEVTHTWKLMKQKVDMEIKASHKISPFKPTINLSKPLIASDYFYHVQKQSKRIQREHRKRIASLNKSQKFNKVKDDKSFQKS